MEEEKAAGDSGQRNGVGSEMVNKPSDSGQAADSDGKGDEIPLGNGRTGGGQGNGESSDAETVILINLNVEEAKLSKGDDKEVSCVIDVRCKDSWDGEKVCRICHLGSEGSIEVAVSSADPGGVVCGSSSSMELIQLGCGCKDELGVAHPHCAEAWFKLKGNRVCEICGEAAKNITGIVVDRDRILDALNHVRLMNEPGGGATENRQGGCWKGQPFCNFLMACLVIAFVLPWFFRVNMF
ncbi:hypothetical protein LINGRAHAP2_LOCUS5652 [Linum grandiflorum]